MTASPQNPAATYTDTRLFIDGQWSDAADGRTLDVLNPASGAVIGTVAHASTADLDRALDAADRGFRDWRDRTAAERASIMHAASGLVRERVDRIAELLTLEQGKPLREAKGEILAAADIIDWFADEGLRVYGRLVPSRFDATVRQMVIKDPVGPVAAFTPWNFPVNQVVRKVSAALATGCSMIVKAPEETPQTGRRGARSSCALGRTGTQGGRRPKTEPSSCRCLRRAQRRASCGHLQWVSHRA